MKTQHQFKTAASKEDAFANKKITQQSKNDFDEVASFDTDWSYSYIMDYILSHKTKKRKQ
ncbi:MAG TPA: hypothetical protein VK835_04825 [Bacteroidia bacterium]|jgi:hypothetical protein|nr:hypothetical protein [Bacteroidia bacterium]